MKSTDTIVITAAMAVALGIVFWPRRTRAATSYATNPAAPRVGAGDGGTVWNDNATAAYRDALRRESTADWTGP